ncbi:MAG: LysM peptidoglycan-binding domain-containing protein [Chloroflexota bacterium]|nr:LysM peptidoglycan-binding domain-containing protein [Chloroflexota bacterium]
MKRGRDWKHALPDTKQIAAILPTLVIALLLTSYSLYIVLYTVPQARIMSDTVEQLNAKKRELSEMRQNREERSPSLERQLHITRNTLNEKYKVFLSKSVAAQSLDELYDHADQTQVTILDLRNQPSPEKKKALYDVEAFRLQVEGDMSNLLRFTSRVHETIHVKSFVVSNVSIVPRENTHLLTMNIALYTSPYASGNFSASPIIEGSLRAQESTQVSLPIPNPIVEDTQPPSHIERELWQPTRPQSWPTHWPWPPPGDEDVPGTVPPSELPSTVHLHVVEEGDTLLSIALQYNSSVEAIVTANHLEDGGFHVGQSLRVPIYSNDTSSRSPAVTRSPGAPLAA